MWQKCPICEGSGKKVDYGNMGGVDCYTCQGHGIIDSVTGLPPRHASKQQVKSESTNIVVSQWLIDHNSSV